MRLLRIEIVAASTCGGLLDGFVLDMRESAGSSFSPSCFLGPNGAGKSQLLQVIAEMFQAAFHVCLPSEERRDSNSSLQFRLEYLIRSESDTDQHIRISRVGEGKHKPILKIERKLVEGWEACDPSSPSTNAFLPTKVVGYTSGDNETLSLPFLTSRSGYADEVTRKALRKADELDSIPDTRLMLVDYSTHLELLVANLLLGDPQHRESLLSEVGLKDLSSFRCVIQLAHSAARKAPSSLTGVSSRRGIQLTPELEGYLDHLRSCSTSYSADAKTESYTYDFHVDDAVRAGFRSFFSSAAHLYSALHKLAMLNDLAIPKRARDRFKRDTNNRRFASRLPEPQDEDKVFRFEQVTFIAKEKDKIVDYVSLSDGEHQLVQLLGTFAMLSSANILFLLDEPESHFNPRWRVELLSRIEALGTENGVRKDDSSTASRQECIMTTHAPFVPSDMPRERVFIFTKEMGEIKVRHPGIQTFGSRFDSILEECFGVRPPISGLSRAEIKRLMASNDVDEVRDGITRLGNSVDKVFLVDKLKRLSE